MTKAIEMAVHLGRIIPDESVESIIETVMRMNDSKGISAVEDATYVSVSDENGRMDDDLHEILIWEELTSSKN